MSKTAELCEGLIDFEPWLLDLLREGIADLPARPFEFWQAAAARLVDAGAPSAGNLLLEIPVFFLQNPDWQMLTLRRLGELFLLIQAAKKFETLSKSLKNEVTFTAGLRFLSKHLIGNADGIYANINDTWQVLGENTGKTVDSSLQYRRVWLRGKTSELNALLLDFKFRDDDYKIFFTVGSEWQGELVFYPGNAGLRAALKAKQNPPYQRIENTFGHDNFAAFQKYLTELTQTAFWLQNAPCCLKNTVPVIVNRKQYLIDNEQFMIPIEIEEKKFWKLLAISGNAPITVFGEWQHDKLQVLGILSNKEWIGI